MLTMRLAPGLRYPHSCVTLRKHFNQTPDVIEGFQAAEILSGLKEDGVKRHVLNLEAPRLIAWSERLLFIRVPSPPPNGVAQIPEAFDIGIG